MRNSADLVMAIEAIIIISFVLIIPSSASDGLIVINNVSPFTSPFGTISINATTIDNVGSLPVYHGSFGENGSINIQFQQIGKVRQNITTESEAPAVAQKLLEQYGSLPPDAVLNGASITYMQIYNHTLQAISHREPMFTTVFYSREIDGFWIYGDGNTIILTLGENGELLRIFKVWRDYTYTRDVKIIPVYSAFEKLQRGELLNAPMVSNENITINIASPDYYAKVLENGDSELEPIWLLVGTTKSGSRVGFYVYARQFANFTATPTEVTKWQPVQFNDTSEASPSRWHWDFGDGTNSTEQNPSHLYKYGGNFTVNLTVWNDLGSDTISRQDFVRVYYDGVAPVAGFTSNFSYNHPTAPLTIAFNDTSSGNITSWFWVFDDGTNSTEQNPIHTITFNGMPEDYESWYAVRLTVTDGFGRSSEQTAIHEVSNVERADFSGEPRSGIAPLTVNFSNLMYDQEKDWIYYWMLDYGDGTSDQWTYDGMGYYPENTTHVYSVPGNYSVTLVHHIMDNVAIIERTRTDYITVYPGTAPFADFMANTTSGKEPLAVAFTDLSEGSPALWNWSFGDGFVSSEQDPVHVYSAAGTYTVSLMVSESNETNMTLKTDYIHVYPTIPPVADFIANQTTGYSPLPVAFTDTSTNVPVNWSWSFGDGTVSSDRNPEHIYPAPGNYSVTLTVMNDEGSDTATRSEFVHILFEAPPVVNDPGLPPVSAFTVNTTTGKMPLTVGFTDTSLFFPDHWSWSFGDGATSGDQNPAHVYALPGTYTVNLTTSNAFGKNETSKAEYITVLPLSPPGADFTANITSGIIPLAVEFTDTSSGSPSDWIWTFGDGGTSVEQNPTHIYTIPGEFAVTLQVTNEDGSSATTKEQFITGNILILPVAEFTANTTSGNAPLAVGFTDQSAGFPVTWHWTFGDGATSDEQNPSHIYPDIGIYSVSLETTTPEGSNTETKTDYITVTSNILPPVARFTGEPTCGKAPLMVKFNDTSSGFPIDWFWDFGDGANTTEQSPVHTYTTAGKYTVSLKATNAGGSNSSTRTEYITVSGSVKPPVANFYAKPTSGKAPLSVKFTDASTGSPSGWFWEFGDGTIATTRNPVHRYASPGKYSVSLTVTNTVGSNMKTRSEYITVKGTPPPNANFYAKPTSGKAPLSVKFTDTSTGSPSGWFWEFGDGTTATTRNPVHRYASPGKYSVSLTASNAGGESTKTKTQYITITGTTPTPTHTCTPSHCEPHQVPLVTGSITQDNKVRLDWDVITNPCLQGYKVVISKTNPNPKYPGDGYMFWLTDRNTNYSVICSTDHYNGGDFGSYLQPGERYYFSITAVYSDTKISGNVIELEYPA